MFRFLARWTLRIVVVLALACMAVYIGDWAVFHLRGAPMDKVTVNRYLEVPLKAQKTEFDYLGTEDVPCPESLLPQAGQTPCWQLRRHPNQGTTL